MIEHFGMRGCEEVGFSVLWKHFYAGDWTWQDYTLLKTGL